jgi:hypothetical protein
MHEAEVVFLKLLGDLPGDRGNRQPAEPFGFQDTVDAVMVEVRQEVLQREGEVVECEAGHAAQVADNSALLSVARHRRCLGREERSRQSSVPRLRHLRMVSVLTP